MSNNERHVRWINRIISTVKMSKDEKIFDFDFDFI